MYKEIDAEIKAFENELFTGHVRFGIEHGDIMSLSVTTKLEPASSYIYDMEKEIARFCADEKDFYGAIEFNFSFGKITGNNYAVSLHGELLKARLRKTQNREVLQCKNVKVVVKK